MKSSYGFIVFSWWKITTNLGWALLELSDGLKLFNSVDHNSVVLARLLFAAYLVMALVLLINMLIALLSNTYQRVQVCYGSLSCLRFFSKFGGISIRTVFTSIVKPKPIITTKTNRSRRKKKTMNQSKLEAKKCNRRQLWAKVC